MSLALDTANNLAGAAALVNGMILWPVVRSLQKAVNELKLRSDRVRTTRRARRARSR